MTIDCLRLHFLVDFYAFLLFPFFPPSKHFPSSLGALQCSAWWPRLNQRVFWTLVTYSRACISALTTHSNIGTANFDSIARSAALFRPSARSLIRSSAPRTMAWIETWCTPIHTTFSHVASTSLERRRFQEGSNCTRYLLSLRVYNRCPVGPLLIWSAAADIGSRARRSSMKIHSWGKFHLSIYSLWLLVTLIFTKKCMELRPLSSFHVSKNSYFYGVYWKQTFFTLIPISVSTTIWRDMTAKNSSSLTLYHSQNTT